MIPDNAADSNPRRLAIRCLLADRVHNGIVIHSAGGFPTRTGQELLDPLRTVAAYAMPVESPDLGEAASQFAVTLRELAGEPPIIDLAHLVPGPNGPTAPLVPGDPVLDVRNADVALSGPYQGRRRMTLTYPILHRARRVLWVVTGGEKQDMVNRLLSGDCGIPAGRVSSERALLLADSAAAGQRASTTSAI